METGYEENPEYVRLIIDNDEKILWGIRKNGEIYPNTEDSSIYEEIEEQLVNKQDKEAGKGLIDTDVAASMDYSSIPEFIKMEVDADDKIISVIRKDGVVEQNILKANNIFFGETAYNKVLELLQQNMILTKNYTEAIVNNFPMPDYQTDEDGWDIPATTHEVAVARKSDIFTNIKWTPKHNLLGNRTYEPASGYQFVKDVEVTGIPYSGPQQIDKFVGHDVSFTTFMTAVNNPYSLLYTECVRNDDRQYSSWGYTYNGAASSGLYYGSVCSGFAVYAAGLKMDYKTYQSEYLTDYGNTFGTVYPWSPQGLRIGDLIWQGGHDIIVSGTKRAYHYKDTDLDPVNIESLDNRVFLMPFNPIYTTPDPSVSGDDGYRPGFFERELYRSKNRCPALRSARQYQNVINEFDEWDLTTPYQYNNDICTFAGDKACFREDQLVVINYNLDG